MAKLLLIDDDKVGSDLFITQLEKSGFEVEYADCGKVGLKSIDENSYDLILLDIMMPDLSGIAVLESIRKDANRFELPVIMVTSRDQNKDIVDALKRDASDYVTKPVNFDVAKARIETQLKIKELYDLALKAKQQKTINTMVATLNHEINNPLAVAVGNLSLPFEKIDEQKIKKTLNSLDRVAKIVKKIENISSSDLEEEDYSKEVSIFKV